MLVLHMNKHRIQCAEKKKCCRGVKPQSQKIPIPFLANTQHQHLQTKRLKQGTSIHIQALKHGVLCATALQGQYQLPIPQKSLP